MLSLGYMGYLLLLTVTTVLAINSTALTTPVEWDPNTLFLLGQRVFILSAEGIAPHTAEWGLYYRWSRSEDPGYRLCIRTIEYQYVLLDY